MQFGFFFPTFFLAIVSIISHSFELAMYDTEASVSQPPEVAHSTAASMAAANITQLGRLNIDLPPAFKGDGTVSFTSWSRRFEVSMQAMYNRPAAEMSSVLASVLPTKLAEAAFLYWDSLSPAVKEDYKAVKKRLQDVFGPSLSLPFFQTHINARPRKPGESLEVYSADVTRLVMEAFPDYGRVAQEGEKFRRFVAGLDPALQAKIHEMGAGDLDEALVVAGRCERARAALNLHASYPPMRTMGQVSVTCSDTASIKLLEAMERLTVKVSGLQSDVHQLQERDTYRGQRFDHWANRSSASGDPLGGAHRRSLSGHGGPLQSRNCYSPDRGYGRSPEFYRRHRPDSPEFRRSRHDWISDGVRQGCPNFLPRGPDFMW
ncbi:uncharacterized protein LOC127587812 [Hippocampus zosterae]|uniref:uncharacterized protein LOC127587812 n=1 Tax=Hippocampus zosterae TaxID=109293 RepID=UPI00223E0949|nr:uncharacterized protein LOC127587812 [Hippocampus zosterae]